MSVRILLVNPAIYDFSAYDYWLKPYGLLRVAGMLRGCAEMRLFDYLDRLHPAVQSSALRSDRWGRGELMSESIPKPKAFSGVLQADQQEMEGSMRFAHGLGIRVMLSEFSPIPGTPDGEACRRWLDLDEPLNHNKTTFTLTALGDCEVNRLKGLCKVLNRSLGTIAA
jgi:hypothetical protein